MKLKQLLKSLQIRKSFHILTFLHLSEEKNPNPNQKPDTHSTHVLPKHAILVAIGKYTVLLIVEWFKTLINDK